MTQPVRPRCFAFCAVDARKKTPCTRPITSMWARTFKLTTHKFEKGYVWKVETEIAVDFLNILVVDPEVFCALRLALESLVPAALADH